MSAHILLIDDDQRLCKLLGKFLRDQGFLVSSVFTTQEAKDALTYFDFDLIVLDCMLPIETGIAFLPFLKKRYPRLPVLMLTALGEVENRIEGLEAGADDYLSKPFDPRELALRIKSLLKRGEASHTLNFGIYKFNLNTNTLYRGETAVFLTTTEQTLLRLFIDRKNTPLPREDIAQRIQQEERTVDVQINRLRKKIESNPKQPLYIQTLRGIGYTFIP